MPEDAIELVVEAGKEKVLAARTHQFSRIHVKPGGRVVITPRSSRWSIWWVTGEVVIEGTVIGRDFARSPNPITDVTPDGKSLTHKFESTAEGGTGGSGGAASRGETRAGGSGARGTIDFGGGGGSPGGIHILGPQTRLGSEGLSASDWRGAEPAPDGGYDRRGGDGARIARHPNGALLLIYATGKFSGDGVFDFAGQDGLEGSSGSSGTTSNRGQVGGGGGGGGAPGGDGGRLLVVAADIQNNTRFDALGGRGGPGGPAGPPTYGATAGRSGENGNAGYMDEIPLDEWSVAAITRHSR